MLFNSVEFIFVFLPVTLLGYFFFNRLKAYSTAKVWLLFASMFFYAWWNPKYVLLLVASILFNYFVARAISREKDPKSRKWFLVGGILFNVVLLGYFKYADFFIGNFNMVFETDYNLIHIILPLGISFFTFQQIAFLVDSYKKIVKEYNFIHYGVFVSFFPQLIAGPIVHHSEMMPQFLDTKRATFNPQSFVQGVFLFNMGLAKKIVIADTFGKVANFGYRHAAELDTLESWVTSFAYTCQLYFDFSGYSDMAIGAGLLFNIQLPINFMSPHKSENIQQFYRRWHITLSRFLRDYIYIPLGGNRGGTFRTYWNLVLTFLIGGFWHGANWTFVFWGGLNGLAFVVQRVYQKITTQTPRWAGIAITFLFVMIVRVFFRANEWGVATDVLHAMIGGHQGEAIDDFVLLYSFHDFPLWLAGVVLLFCPNTNQVMERFNTNFRYLIFLILLILLNVTFLNSAIKQDFLYFDF